MQITSISYPKITNYNNKPKKQASFGGLTQMFEKTVYAMPYDRAQQLVGMYKKPDLFVGYFPADILERLKKASSSGQELKQKIQVFNRSLSELAQRFRASEKLALNNVDEIDLTNFAYRSILKLAKKDKKSSIGWVSSSVKLFLTPSQMEQTMNGSNFEKTMKEIGLIPEDGKTVFEYVGEGAYKDCFKIKFLNKKGKDIIHPKAFVIGRTEDLGREGNQYLIEKLKKHMETMGYKRFKEEIKKLNAVDILSSPFLDRKIIRAIKPFYDEKYKTVRIYEILDENRKINDINGILPEANAALKIRRDLGRNIKKSNITEPYIFDLKSKCGLLEFADDDLGPCDVHYNFQRHGLKWLDERKDNYGADGRRIVDFGSIIPLEKEDYYGWR